MRREKPGSRPKAGRLSLLTAYFFNLIPALALVSASVAIGRSLATRTAGSSDSGGLGRLVEKALLLVVSVLVTAAALRVKGMLEGLQRTGKGYQLALESAADGIIMADTSGGIVEANTAACEMLGYSRAEVLDLGLHKLARGCEQEGAVSPFSEMLCRKTVLRECRFQQADGALRPVEVNGRMLDDGRIMIIIRDITARKKAEESLRASELRYRLLFQANLASELKYRLLFQGNLAGVYRATARGRFLECNQSFAAMLGTVPRDRCWVTPRRASSYSGPQISDHSIS